MVVDFVSIGTGITTHLYGPEFVSRVRDGELELETGRLYCWKEPVKR